MAQRNLLSNGVNRSDKPMAAKRNRDVQLNFRVSPHELELIETKMAQVGTTNREAYLRKMAIDGYVVKLDLPELRELVSLLRYSSNNLNQLTKRVHETGRFYDADLEDILQKQDAIWAGVNEILSKFSQLS
jgi:predicted DNA binding CopG/RHH family protein